MPKNRFSAKSWAKYSRRNGIPCLFAKWTDVEFKIDMNIIKTFHLQVDSVVGQSTLRPIANWYWCRWLLDYTNCIRYQYHEIFEKKCMRLQHCSCGHTNNSRSTGKKWEKITFDAAHRKKSPNEFHETFHDFFIHLFVWCFLFTLLNLTCSRPRPTHLVGGANADGNGFTKAPPLLLNGLLAELADVTAGCRKWGGKPCNRCAAL